MKRVGITETPTLEPDGGDEDIRSLTQRRRNRSWIGSHAQLIAMRPEEGSITADGYVVIETKLVRRVGGQGKLTVSLIKERTPFLFGPDNSAPVVTPVVTHDWERFVRPLRQHPKFSKFSSSDWAICDAWEKEENSTLRRDFKYRVPDGWDTDGKPKYKEETISYSLLEYCKRVLSGIESYDDWRPTIRRESLLTYKPSIQPCGFVDPDVPEPVSGYEFLKTGYSVTDQGAKGMHRLIESWEGAKDFDDLLYSTSASRSAPAGKAKTKKRGGRRGTAI